MGGVVARKIIVEVEVPEGRSLEEVLKGVKYRVLDSVGEEELLEELRKGVPLGVKKEEMRRTEIYADRA